MRATSPSRDEATRPIRCSWTGSTARRKHAAICRRRRDIATLLAFDHQMHAMNLLTRLNWESRVAAERERRPRRRASAPRERARRLLAVRRRDAAAGAARRRGRASRNTSRPGRPRIGKAVRGAAGSDRRLMRYPCSYMVYSEAFDGLPPSMKDAVYRRMLDILSGHESRPKDARLSADDRRAVLEILHDTKPDFPRDIP